MYREIEKARDIGRDKKEKKKERKEKEKGRMKQ